MWKLKLFSCECGDRHIPEHWHFDNKLKKYIGAENRWYRKEWIKKGF